MIDKSNLQTTEETETKSPVQSQVELLKYFASGQLGLLKAERRRELKEEHYGDISTALVLGGFAAVFLLTCFIWTGMSNMRARRREKRIEKLKLSLVTKL